MFEILTGRPRYPQFTHFYSITPKNFLILPEEKQKRKLVEFYELLRMLQNPAMITLQRSPIRIRYGVEEQKMEVAEVLLDSVDPLEDILERLGMSFSIDEAREPLHSQVRSEGIRDFRINLDGAALLGRAYTIHKTPTMLPPAWVHSVFHTFHKVHIHVLPVRPDDAIRKIESREILYSGVKSEKADVQKKLDDIRTLKRDLELGNTAIFLFTINGFIFAADRPGLAKISRQVARNTGALNVRVWSGLAQQLNLAMGGGARWLGSIQSLGILYPFASSDMLEVPNGIMLGRNRDTKSPVIYDVNLRKNHNIFTAGTTGSGKSFTNKIILKRFIEKRPNTMCIVIDPQGEYAPYAEYFGLDAIEVAPGERYGLDPYGLFGSRLEAADLIANVTDAPTEIRKEWRAMADSVSSLRDMHDAASDLGKKYLADLVEGSVAEMFRGETRFSDRMIISLKKTDGQEFEGLLILLVLAYAWKRVNDLPAKQWKFILLDEAWRMTRIAQSARKIGEIARQGRKRSLIFAISTQQFSDMDRALDDESRLTELFDTKIVMNLSQTAARSTGKALDLTEEEMERIMNFRAGNGLLQTSDNSIYLKFEATEEETKKFFNTKEEKE